MRIRTWVGDIDFLTTSGFRKLTAAILEFYFRFPFLPNFRHRHVILHWPAKFRQNRTTLGEVLTSYRSFNMAAGSHIGFDLDNIRPPTKCNCWSQLGPQIWSCYTALPVIEPWSLRVAWGSRILRIEIVWSPSLLRCRKWPRVTKWTHSRVVGLRLEVRGEARVFRVGGYWKGRTVWGPKGRKRGWSFGGGGVGSQPPPHQVEDLGERCELPSGVPGGPRPPSGFSIFWVLWVASPGHPGMQGYPPPLLKEEISHRICANPTSRFWDVWGFEPLQTPSPWLRACLEGSLVLLY